MYTNFKFKLLAVLIIFSFSNGFNCVQAQTMDYTKQINALKQSFDDKSPEALKPHISSNLSFGSYPAGVTVQILGQVFKSFPKILTLQTLEVKSGEALLEYNFTAWGKRKSRLLFNEEGEIVGIELIDNLLKEQAEAQKELASQKQAPTPGQLAKEYPFTQIEFASKDGQMITGNLYKIGNTQPIILLCHQAGYNKYEYADIAPKLNQMGFNALAIDQRSGGPFGGQNNETATRSQAAGLDVGMLQAEQDLEAAVDYLHQKFGRKVILWGSSYSSSLALFVTGKSDRVSAVIAFSPGDYFGEQKPSLSAVLKGIDKPFFITSSKEEAETVSELLADYVKDAHHIQFVPEGKGYHGSRALWYGQKGGDEYWQAVTDFLSKISQ